MNRLKTNISFYLSMATLSLAFFLMFFFTFTLFYEYPTVIPNYKDGMEDFEIIQKEVRAGERIEYIVDIISQTDRQQKIEKSIVCPEQGGGQGSLLKVEETIGVFPYGEHRFTSGVVVPQVIKPGDCYVEFVVGVKINPFRTIVKRFQTDYFEVID